MRVAAYVRVSTDEQNVETQEREIARYASFKAWSDVRVFRDEGVSGTKESRPAFDALLAAARAGEFDVVVVWRFDRAGRSTSHLLRVLTEFDELGVGFVSVQEQIDTTTAAGRLMFTIFAAFAQFERDVIAERTSAALARLKAEGKHVGRPREADRAAVVYLRGAGFSPAEIARRVGRSRSHVNRILRDERTKKVAS